MASLLEQTTDRVLSRLRDVAARGESPLSIDELERAAALKRDSLRKAAERMLRRRGYNLRQIHGGTAGAEAKELAERYERGRALLVRALEFNDSEPVYVRSALAVLGISDGFITDDLDLETEFGFSETELPYHLGIDGSPRVAAALVETAVQWRSRLLPEALAVSLASELLEPVDSTGLEVLSIPPELADRFITEHHSTLARERAPGNMFSLGAFFRGNLVAVALAGTPTAPWSKGRGFCTKFGVLEVTRVASVSIKVTNRRGREVPLSAGSKLVARLIDLLPRSGRRGEEGCLLVTYSLASEEGTTYLALADKGLRPTREVKPRGSSKARSNEATALKTEAKVAWEAGPAALPPRWDLLLRDDETMDDPPRRIAGAMRALERFAARQQPTQRSSNVRPAEPVVAWAVKQALTPDVRHGATEDEDDDGCFGYCYVASEAAWHLLGGAESTYRPRQIQHEGVSHWYLYRENGGVLDLTACQFDRPVPYDRGRGRGFLTAAPSKRAQVVIERARSAIASRPLLEPSDELVPELVVRSVADGIRALSHPAIVSQHEETLRLEPEQQLAVLLPCADTKPFPESPSHKHGYLPALHALDVDLWVVSEPLGVIPYDWVRRWPNAHYDFPPRFVRGEGRAILVSRLRGWLAAVGAKYDALYLALPGHHMGLVREAAEGLSLKLVDVSISRCRQTARACRSGDFRATTERYRDFVRATVGRGEDR